LKTKGIESEPRRRGEREALQAILDATAGRPVEPTRANRIDRNSNTGTLFFATKEGMEKFQMWMDATKPGKLKAFSMVVDAARPVRPSEPYRCGISLRTVLLLCV